MMINDVFFLFIFLTPTPLEVMSRVESLEAEVELAKGQALSWNRNSWCGRQCRSHRFVTDYYRLWTRARANLCSVGCCSCVTDEWSLFNSLRLPSALNATGSQPAGEMCGPWTPGTSCSLKGLDFLIFWCDDVKKCQEAIRSVILTKWCSAQPIQQAFWWFSGPRGARDEASTEVESWRAASSITRCRHHETLGASFPWFDVFLRLAWWHIVMTIGPFMSRGYTLWITVIQSVIWWLLDVWGSYYHHIYNLRRLLFFVLHPYGSCSLQRQRASDWKASWISGRPLAAPLAAVWAPPSRIASVTSVESLLSMRNNKKNH